jgi:hypothetical protein
MALVHPMGDDGKHHISNHPSTVMAPWNNNCTKLTWPKAMEHLQALQEFAHQKESNTLQQSLANVGLIMSIIRHGNGNGNMSPSKKKFKLGRRAEEVDGNRREERQGPTKQSNDDINTNQRNEKEIDEDCKNDE